MVKATSRRERERRQHRQEILDAAEAVFAENGFHRSTVEDVAARAEFSVGTLYNFFSSKEELYQSLIEQRIQYLSEAVNRAMDEAGDPVGAVRAYVESKIKLSLEHETFVRLYTRERMGDRFSNNELWQRTAGPLYAQVIKRLGDTFAAGVGEGKFRNDVPPADMAVALDGLTDGFLFEWLVEPERASFRDRLEVIMQLFMQGVSPG